MMSDTMESPLINRNIYYNDKTNKWEQPNFYIILKEINTLPCN